MYNRFAKDGDKEALKNIKTFAETFARDMMEVSYMNGDNTDIDDLYEKFSEHISDAIINGLQDGIDRWDNEKPREYDDYDENKERMILDRMGVDYE